jgi:chemotaxis protein MotB
VVEGHTDNIPISTPQFPSNWELSAARAASVVRLFIDTGMDPRRLTATGYADQRPVADNATGEGRQSNRRVAITIESRLPDNRVELPLSE